MISQRAKDFSAAVTIAARQGELGVIEAQRVHDNKVVYLLARITVDSLTHEHYIQPVAELLLQEKVCNDYRQPDPDNEDRFLPTEKELAK